MSTATLVFDHAREAERKRKLESVQRLLTAAVREKSKAVIDKKYGRATDFEQRIIQLLNLKSNLN